MPTDKKSCPACGKPTWLLSHESDKYDSDWTETIARQKLILAPGITDVPADLIRWKGHDWIAQEMLELYGYGPQDLDVVCIRGEYYELVGKADQNGTVGWWVEKITPLDFDAEVGHPVLDEEPMRVWTVE